jgi:hypothetical protein
MSDFSIGKAVFGTPSLTQNEPSRDDKVRKALQQIVETCRHHSDPAAALADIEMIAYALLEQK